MDFSVVHNDSHPLLRLISDLKSSLNAAQNDAHSSSVRLLRHSLSSSQALERTHALQHENSILNNELHALRSLFLSNKSPEADRQSINQLTLSLRTLNEKLTATEILLASRTVELTHALGDLQKSRCAADTTHQLLAASRARESELELKVRTAEERARMTDRAIGEYANLVRTLQGRTVKEEDAHVHVSSHEDLLRQFSQERENLQTQLSSAQTDLALLSSENTALSKSAQVTLAELKDLRVKLQLHERDDATATKMVARYMKFSQTQITQLQTSLSTLSTRHAATLSSLTTQIQSHVHALTLAQSHNERLLSALDDLGNEVMKEAHGRRREVRLRIKLVGREERVLEGLRRWLRRAEERHAKLCTTDDGARTVLVEMIQDAKILIDNLDDPLLLHPQQLSQGVRPSPVSGSLARLFTIQSMIDDLVEDIQREQTKRIALEKLIIRQEVDVSVDREKVDLLSSKDQNVRIASSTSIHSECLLDGVEDPILSPALQTTNHGITSQGPILVNAGSVSSTPPFTSTPMPMPTPTPTPRPATPIIKITPPPPSSPSLADHDSETEETKFENDDDSMSLEREDDGNQIVEGVCNNLDGEEGGIARDLLDVGRGAPHVDAELDARATLPANIPDNETATSKSMETTPDEIQVVSENDDIDIRSSNNDMLFSNDRTALAHPQPRTALPSLISSSQSPRPDQILPEPCAPHPLLDDLSKVRNRYDNLQRSFHACHVAIEGLKASFPFIDTNNSSSAFDVHLRYPSNNGSDFLSSSSSSSTTISNDVLRAIVQRLDDYTEDARVELEIRISDEEVMGRGYEALLMLPGALSSTVLPSSPAPDDEKDGDGIISSTGLVVDAEAQMRAFIDGTDPMVSRAMGLFKKKLEDIEHDVVIVKKVLHDPSSLLPSSASTKTMMESPSSTLDDSPGSGWSLWTRAPISRPLTPTTPAPTFGNIMTSRNTMLRRTAATFGLSLGSQTKRTDLVSSLGLKVPMPDFDLNLHASSGSMRSGDDGGGGDGQGHDDAPDGVSMKSFGGLGLDCLLDAPRSGTMSASVYMLGMGIGSPGVMGTDKRRFSTALGGVPVAALWSAGRGGKGPSAGESENENGSSSSLSSSINRRAPEDEDVD